MESTTPFLEKPQPIDIHRTAMYHCGMKITKDLVAASAAPLVLSILTEGESYGYAIIQKVRDLSDGHLEWTDGMLYPVLHRLEEQDLIAASWKVSDAGRKRKYYSLTTQGKKELAEQKRQWQIVHSTLTGIWGLGHA